MSNFSDYLANKLLDHVLRNTAYTSPNPVYLALFDDNTGLETNNQTNEIAGVNYTRQTVTCDAPTGGVTQNSADVAWSAAGAGGWGTIVAAAWMDASSSGQILYYFDLDASKTVNEGDTFKFLAGQAVVEHQ